MHSPSPGRVESGISVRGDVTFAPEIIGHTSSESSGGRDAAAALVSTIALSSTPASSAKVRYQSHIWIYLPRRSNHLTSIHVCQTQSCQLRYPYIRTQSAARDAYCMIGWKRQAGRQAEVPRDIGAAHGGRNEPTGGEGGDLDTALEVAELAA